MRPMKIRHDRICLKPFSLEWINYHCFSILLFVCGACYSCCFVRELARGLRNRYWLAALLLFGTGLVVHMFQRSKLKFRSIPLPRQHDGLQERIRTLLIDRGWRIEYDNRRYLQAVNRKGIPFLDCDLLVLSWRNDEIRWALIYDPWYNMAGGIFTFNRYGRKTVKAIKALAGDSAEATARKLG